MAHMAHLMAPSMADSAFDHIKSLRLVVLKRLHDLEHSADSKILAGPVRHQSLKILFDRSVSTCVLDLKGIQGVVACLSTFGRFICTMLIFSCS